MTKQELISQTARSIAIDLRPPVPAPHGNEWSTSMAAKIVEEHLTIFLRVALELEREPYRGPYILRFENHISDLIEPALS